MSDHVYYGTTKGLCRICRSAVDAKIVFRDDEVHLEKYCPRHGRERCLIASSVSWYLDALSFFAPDLPPGGATRPTKDGCPFDCGPCVQHRQRTFLPVVPITSACNLDCPICYTVNRNDPAYRMTRVELGRILERLAVEEPDLDIINFTGGEPTLHPELPEMLAQCAAVGIRRLTVSTNGLRLLHEEYLQRLGAAGARIVLSLDTLSPEADRTLLGADTVAAKRRVLEHLQAFDVPTTILPAVAAGINDGSIGELLGLVLTRPNMRSLELHTMAFTGQGGVGFSRRARLTIPDLHRRIAEATSGRIDALDFVPSPLAHPHCYSICYLLVLDGGGYVPFTRLMTRAALFSLLGDSLYIEPRERLEEVFRIMLDELWADPGRLPEADAVMRTLRRLTGEMFPPSGPIHLEERQRIAERSTRAIYIHSHMDEESFDVSRIMRCPVAVPEVDGRMIPTCSYNVLYRDRDPRFADASRRARMQEARVAGESRQ